MKRYLLILAVIILSLSLASCREQAMFDAVDRQLTLFPDSRAQDFYKSFCQDFLGPEHLIEDPASAAHYLSEELRSYGEDLDSLRYRTPALLYYPVGDRGDYIRVDLAVVLEGMVGEDAFLDAFVRSANGGNRAADGKWAERWQDVARILRKYHAGIPNLEKDLGTLDSLVARGHYIMHHSEAFREAYHPHYRIIRKDIFNNELKPLIDSH